MKTLETPTNAVMTVDGRAIVNFAGSAYFGISREPALIEAAVAALRQYGPRVHITPEYGLLTPPQSEVEAESARFFGTPAAIYIASGYLIGLTVLTGLRARYDLVLLDERPHYSLHDAARASGAIVRTFAHLDCTALEAELVRARAENLRPIIGVDGVCPTLGSLPRFDIYARLASQYGAKLFVDESHSFGVLGASGRGALEECGVPPDQALRGGSLGKAFCAAGAVIVGAEADIEPLRVAPCVRGAVWGLVPGAAMAAASLRFVRSRPDLLIKLRSNVTKFKTGLREMGIQIEDSPSPIAAFVTGSASQMQQLQQRLLDEDLFVLYTQYVGAGPEGVIRISIFADHTHAQIDRLLDALRRHT